MTLWLLVVVQAAAKEHLYSTALPLMGKADTPEMTARLGDHCSSVVGLSRTIASDCPPSPFSVLTVLLLEEETQ